MWSVCVLLRGGGPCLEASCVPRCEVTCWGTRGPGWVSGRVCVRPYPSTVRCCLKKSFAANLMAFSGVTSVRFTAAPGWRTTRGAEHSLNYGTTSLCPLKLQMGDIFVLVSNNWFATAHSSAQMSNTTVKWHLNSVCQQKPEGSNRRPQFTE